MQIPPDRFVLGGLLGSCRIHGELEAAERVAQQLLELSLHKSRQSHLVHSDCHTATKLISKVYDREIIVRDRNRCQRFRDGSCCCNDFW
ncbi:hypothetical protein ACFX1Z_017774 [Malus domestica]